MLTPFRPTAPAEDKTPIEAYRQTISRQQLLLQQRHLPVLVLLEGWGGAGKGYALGRIIRNLDPRFYSVTVLQADPSEEERRRPFIYRFFRAIPAAGHFAFLDAGWMEQLMREKFAGRADEECYAARVRSIRTFERQLVDNGYLLIKLFLHLDEETQRKRFAKLQKRPDTAWRVTEGDRWQNRHYALCHTAFERYLCDTDAPYAPWLLVDATEKRQLERQILRLLTDAINRALEAGLPTAPAPRELPRLLPMPRLSEVELNRTLPRESYREQRKALQGRLRELHNALYRARIPVILVYEGWDAAGKGGNIRRVTDALDPRGFEVIPIAGPQPFEKDRHYLWRFWARLPKDGHIAIFDRSWYGRVLVERVEGFCSNADWQRAYREINEFERELCGWGAVVLKFWLHIDPQTQLARFQARQNTPEKRWKITDEDWRNREKWPQYEQAVDEMLEKTSTDYAPWHILPSNDKRFARIEALRTLTQAIEKALQAREEGE